LQIIWPPLAKLELVCQGLSLTRKPTPAKNRIVKLWCPDEAGEITESMQGISLVREYSSKQLREIKRHMRRRKLALEMIGDLQEKR
jgi:hypothetical protein